MVSLPKFVDLASTYVPSQGPEQYKTGCELTTYLFSQAARLLPSNLYKMASQYTIPESLLPYLTGSKTDFGSVQDSIIKINSIFLPLVVLSTGSRFYVRFRMLRAAGFDDSQSLKSNRQTLL